MGLISPLGNNLSKFSNALREGTSGIRPLENIPTTNLPITSGGEAGDFTGHIRDFGELEASQKRSIRKGLKVMCREIQMGVAASQLAFQHAELAMDSIDRERTGVVFGSDYIVTQPSEFTAGVRKCVTGPGEFAWQGGGWSNFEHSSCGTSARYVMDGEHSAAAMWNPEGDMGDVEAWELLEPMLYLGRRLRPNTGGPGKYRGGLGFSGETTRCDGCRGVLHC